MLYTLQYYDLVLVGVIVPLLVGVAVGSLTSVPILLAVPVLGGVSVAVMVHALFVNGPVDSVEDLTEEVEELPGPADDLLK